MARIILVPNVKPLNKIIQNSPSPIIEDLSMVSQYAFRAKIISDRYNRGFEKAEINGPVDAFETSGLPIFKTDQIARSQKMLENRADRIQTLLNQPGSYEFEETKQFGTKVVVDTITIIDYDFVDAAGKKGYDSIELPFVPRELSYQPTSKFVGIATMGRNNPHYHFTGSEDSLQFDIDWFSNQDDRKDVINSCRWIEALTKADGYKSPPHRVRLRWGNSDLLFADSVWLVTEAPYTLSDFVKSYRNKDGNIVKVGMLPQQAYQKVTLKRVTNDNLRTSEIKRKLL